MSNPLLTSTASAGQWGAPKRVGLVLATALLVVVVACRPDADLPLTTPVPPVPVPTAYNLVVPPSITDAPRIPADNPLTNQGVELGRFLFYEKMLSADNSLSCSSCHQQAKAFTDGRATPQGVFGRVGRRSAMSLANVMWVDSLNWDFRFTRIEDQNRLPLTHPDEMGQAVAVSVSKLQNTPDYPLRFERAFGSRVITEDRLLKALGQFQRTLISGRSKFDQSRIPGSGVRLTADEEAGYALFSTHPTLIARGGNCGDCHGAGGLFKTRLITSANNGLDLAPADSGIGGVTRRPHDFAKFGVPTLRNIAVTAPYMHNGRFSTLEKVLDHYNEHIERNSPNIAREFLIVSNIDGAPSLMLRADEKRKIIAFLKTLTDTAFLTDRRFANPKRP